MECFYTVYVPFLPQHYRDRVKTDSIAEEELKQAFVEWEEPARFQDGNPNAVQNYIYSKLKYDSDQLGGLSLARGIYRIDIDSYGEIRKVGTVKSCGLPEWDRQVEEIIKGMPRWTPAVSYSGKGSYQNSIWTVPVVLGVIVSDLLLTVYCGCFLLTIPVISRPSVLYGRESSRQIPYIQIIQ